MKRTLAGDTIIEVVLSMALLTMVLFTAWSLANRATQISLAARQRITMVNSMKQQAEIIKSLYAAHQPISKAANKAAFLQAVKGTMSPTVVLKYDNYDPCSSVNYGGATPTVSGAFSLGPNSAYTATVSNPKPLSVGGDPNALVWVTYNQATDDHSLEYVDFDIQACWPTFGGTQKTDSSQFVERLNLQ